MIKTEKISNETESNKPKQLKNGKKVLKAKKVGVKTAIKTETKDVVTKTEASSVENKYQKLIAKKRTFSETDNKNNSPKDSNGQYFKFYLKSLSLKRDKFSIFEKLDAKKIRLSESKNEDFKDVKKPVLKDKSNFKNNNGFKNNEKKPFGSVKKFDSNKKGFDSGRKFDSNKRGFDSGKKFDSNKKGFDSGRKFDSNKKGFDSGKKFDSNKKFDTKKPFPSKHEANGEKPVYTKKELKQQRKQKKMADNYDVSVNMKKIWETLRRLIEISLKYQLF